MGTSALIIFALSALLLELNSGHETYLMVLQKPISRETSAYFQVKSPLFNN